MGLGLLFNANPKGALKATGNLATAANKALTNFMTKEAVEVASNLASKKVTQAAVTQASQKTAQAAEKYLMKEGSLQLSKQNPSNKVLQLEAKISEWLGKETKMIKNEAGDLVLISKDQVRRVRCDFNRPFPHYSRHMHLDEQIGRGLWKESGQIYPTDVPHF